MDTLIYTVRFGKNAGTTGSTHVLRHMAPGFERMTTVGSLLGIAWALLLGIASSNPAINYHYLIGSDRLVLAVHIVVAIMSYSRLKRGKPVLSARLPARRSPFPDITRDLARL